MERFLQRVITLSVIMFTAVIIHAAPTDGEGPEMDFVDNGIYYHVTSIEDRTVEVAKSQDEAFYVGVVDIPATTKDSNGNVYKVTRIGCRAFSFCNKLKEVIINHAMTIGQSAFEWSWSLEKVTIADSVKFENNADNLFAGSRNLEEVRFPSDYKGWLGAGMFLNCEKLKSFRIPEGVTSIGNNTFSCCVSLKNIILPKGLKRIDLGAFKFCESLESIEIPANVYSIGNAFEGCTSLRSFQVSPDNEWFSSKNNCLYNKSGDVLIASPLGLPVVDVPIGTATLQSNSFAGSSVTIVELPESLMEIGDKAFYKCAALKSMVVPNAVTIIGEGAFNGCEALSTVTLGESVSSIGDGAFDGCDVLTEITVLAEVPPTFSVNHEPSLVMAPSRAEGDSQVQEDTSAQVGAFSQEVYDNCVLYVPAVSIDEYRDADTWKEFKHIKGIEVPVESIKLPATESVVVGVSVDLTAIINPADASNTTITWASMDPAIATVDENGTVTGVAEGEVDIKATVHNGKAAICKVTVTDRPPFVSITSLTLSETEVELPLNYTYSLFGIIAPENATNKGLEWSTSNPEVARVYQGVVYGIVPGEAVITAKTTDGSYLSASCKVKIVDPSGIDGIEGDGVKVNGKAGVITVKGATVGATVEVYSMNGACVVVKTVESSVEELPVAASGIYVVRVGGKTFKVAL